MKVVVIGSVASTERVISKLSEHSINIQLVMGFEPEKTVNVSGWVNLREQARSENIPFCGYRNINAPEHIEDIRRIAPDWIFAVGFSQLVCPEILDIPKCGVIGYHPTELPRGRGRAPLAWLVLNESRAPVLSAAL